MHCIRIPQVVGRVDGLAIIYLLAIVQRQIKPLVMFWLARIEQISSATLNKQCRLIVHTFDNRVLCLITLVPQHKV